MVCVSLFAAGKTQLRTRPAMHEPSVGKASPPDGLARDTRPSRPMVMATWTRALLGALDDLAARAGSQHARFSALRPLLTTFWMSALDS